MKNKVALVSGGTRGIGRGAVHELLDSGYSVVVFSRNQRKCQALRKQLAKKYSPKDFAVLRGDVTNESDIKRIVQQTVKRFGTIDLLFNNAGFGYFADADKADMKQVRDMIDTNVYGVMLLTKYVVPIMKRRKQGLILTMASVAGKTSGPNCEFYCATKHAVYGFCEGLRKELKPFNIKVATIAPGMIKTDFFDKREVTRRKKRYGGKMPSMLEVSDIVRIISFIIEQPKAVDIRDVFIMPFDPKENI